MSSQSLSGVLTSLTLALSLAACSGRASLPLPTLPLSPTRDDAFRQAPPESGVPAELSLPDVRAFRLENGLVVIYVVRPETQVVSFRLVTRRPGDMGVRELEMLLAANEFALRERGLAVPELHQHSSSAALSVSGEIFKERFPAALDRLARNVVGRRFSDQDRELIQGLFHRSVSATGSNATLRAEARAWRVLFGATNPNAATTQERLARAGSWRTEDLNSAFAMGWTPEATALVLAGDVEPLEVETMVRQRFGSWHRGPIVSEREEAAPVLLRKPIFVVNAPSAQVAVAVAAKGPVFGSEDEVPFEILTLMLNGSSSRIESVLRRESGLTYGVHAGYESQSSMWLLRTSVDPMKIHDTVDAILGELDRLQKDPVLADELERTRVEYLERCGEAFETNDAVAGALEGLFVLGRGPKRWPALVAAARSTEPSDIVRVARRYLDRTSIVTVLAGPSATIGSQLQWMHVPIEYSETD